MAAAQSSSANGRHVRTGGASSGAAFQYRYRPIANGSEGESSRTAAEAPVTDLTSSQGPQMSGSARANHFRAFDRSAISTVAGSGPGRSTHRQSAPRYARLAVESDDDDDDSDNDSDSETLTSLSSDEDEGRGVDSRHAESAGREAQHLNSAACLLSTGAALTSDRFAVGDAVYIASNLAHPNIGILTDVFTDEQEDEREDEEKSDSKNHSDVPNVQAMQHESSTQLLCTVRFLYWPRDVSQVTSKKLNRLVDEDEIYYTHQAPRLGRRRTKNSLRGGQDIVDNFEYGPSFLYMTVPASEILGKFVIHASADACRKAAQKAERGGGVMFKRKRWPQHLFVQRAIDPQREVFWRIDWTAITQRGASQGKWDLVEGDEEVRNAQSRSGLQATRHPDLVASPLATPGKNADEWARMLAKERGISYVGPQDREALRRQREADHIAALLDTPSRKRKSRKPRALTLKSPSRKRRPVAAAPFSGSDEEDTSASDDDSSDASDDSTAMTSDIDYVDRNDLHGDDSEADEEMLTPEEDDDEWLSTRRPASAPGKKRKRGRRAPASSLPVTPSKRRAIGGIGSSPVKALVTPRSKARILGTVTRAPTSLPSRPVPLTSLSADVLISLTPQARAKRLLHVGATPESLPCRSEQYEEVMACLEDAVEEGLGGCLYVSGVPGTGKTATVREVIRALQRRAEGNEVAPFNFVEINGMKLQDAHDTYGVLWHALTGMRCSNAVALHRLGQHFGAHNGVGHANAKRRPGAQASSLPMGAGGPGRATTIVLMDELDQLVTARQDVMYNMFNWPNGLDSRLVVVAVANTMDLPERILHPKVASRLGMTRITFRPYSDRQLVEIVHARLGVGSVASTGSIKDGDAEADALASATNGCDAVFAPDALVYLAKRISNVSGDARRMLDVSRRAIDAVEDVSPCTVTDVNRGAARVRPVTITDVKRVLDAMVKSGKGAHIAHLSLQAKVALMAMVASVRRSGMAEVELGDIAATYTSLCLMHALPLPGASVSLMANGGTGAGAHRTAGIATASADDLDDASGLARMARLLDPLSALGFVLAIGTGTAGARSGRFARYLLACSHDEVRLALEHDADERVRGML